MCNTEETPETYLMSEIETLISSEASYYFVRHPEMAYSVELWFHIRDWLKKVVCFDYGYPYIDINFVDDCLDYYLNQPRYNYLKKQSISVARKKQLEQDFQ